MSDRPQRRDWIVTGLWLAVAVLIVRCGVLWAMDRIADEVEVTRARERLAIALPREALVAAGAGLVAGLLARAGLGRAVRLVGAGLAAAVLAVALVGWLHADATRVPGIETSNGKLALAALTGVAGVLALTAAFVVRGRATTLARVAVPSALLVAGVLVTGRILESASDTMRVRQVVSDLLFDFDRFEIVKRHKAADVEVGSICPSVDWRYAAAGDRPSLLMPPPAEVRFRVAESDGPVLLRVAAAIDRRDWHRLTPEFPTLSIGFEVAVDGTAVFERVIDLAHDSELAGSLWEEVGDPGIALVPGNEVTLKTWFPDAEVERLRGLGFRRAPGIKAGFGGLVLERDLEVDRARATADRPNIVVVVMDTLRADRTSAYGYERPTTPNLERLAERGTTYGLAHSTASYTWPSTASLLTGLNPERHGVLDGSSCYLASELSTLAEVLQVAGYTTAGFSGNPLIVASKNFDQGFEVFDGVARFRKSDLFVPAAIEWMESRASRRFFLYLQMVDPHAPHQPLPEARAALAADLPSDFSSNALIEMQERLLDGEGWTDDGRPASHELVSLEDQARISASYDATVRTGDIWFGRILDAIENLGLEDKTIVVFTADHGEEIFEHGHVAHGQSLHKELVQVPLVMAGPGIPQGMRVDVPVSNRHLATLAAIGGTSIPELREFVPLHRPADVLPAPVLFSTHHGWWNGWRSTPLLGLRTGSWVVHYAPEAGAWAAEEPTPGGELRLYDVGRDPEEMQDVAGANEDIAERLLDELKTRVNALESKRTAPSVGAGEGTLEMLRDVGYIEGED